MGERLKGRRAVITGAASGIGHATAELFASEGARVLAVDLPGVAASFSTDAVVPFEAGRRGRRHAGLDWSKQQRRGWAAPTSSSTTPRSNGARLSPTPPMPPGTRCSRCRSAAGFRIARAFVPLLEQSGAGRILSTSSMAALRALPGQAAYAAAKAGMIALTRAMALELGPAGITANVILPGPVVTGITRDMTPESAAAWTARAPLRRLGAPEDVARVALFFASDDGGYVTGQALAVDGGIFITA